MEDFAICRQLGLSSTPISIIWVSAADCSGAHPCTSPVPHEFHFTREAQQPGIRVTPSNIDLRSILALQPSDIPGWHLRNCASEFLKLLGTTITIQINVPNRDVFRRTAPSMADYTTWEFSSRCS